MRVGMRLGESSCRAVAVDGPVLHALVEEHGATLEEAIDRVFARLGHAFGADIAEATVDVGEVLAGRDMAEVIAVRISPRPPADAFHAIRLPEFVKSVVVRTVHVRGGHDMRGHVLAPLDVGTLRAELPWILTGNVRNVAITSVGSTAATEHETMVADAILAYDSGAKISISHDFYSNVFRDRDFTTVLNSALIDTGEYLAAMLQDMGARHLPLSRLSYIKNDGGRAPLSRLATTPVHGLYPTLAARILGAARLAGVRDGEIVVCRDRDVKVGRIRGGIPVSGTVMRRGREASLASNAVVIEPYSANHLDSLAIRSVVAELIPDTDTHSPPTHGLVPTVTTQHDIALVGCATTPLTAWVDRLETITDEADLQRVQRIAEEDAKFVTVQSGASPALTEIVESNVFAMPYGHPGIVRIRVQAAGEIAYPNREELPQATLAIR